MEFKEKIVEILPMNCNIQFCISMSDDPLRSAADPRF